MGNTNFYWYENKEEVVVDRCFDFCTAMDRLCRDICHRHVEFRHISMDQVFISFAQTRTASEWGMQARLTPMRFENGELTEIRDGRRYTVQRIFQAEQEMLYILTFYLPRFLNLSYMEKLVTIFHELYHVSPKFDGDIRRFKGSCYMHTGSQANYDRQMEVFVRQYLRKRPPAQLRAFLKPDFRGLKQRCGVIVGKRVPVPRLIPLDAA